VRALVQRVSEASVEVDGRVTGAVGAGFLVLLGVAEGDTEEDADWLAGKVARLRVFEDEEGKMNLSLGAVGGKVLSVSQFTLCADTRKGNRPSFTKAAEPEQGRRLWERFSEELERRGVRVERGVFGARMRVRLVNEGPVTILLDSAEGGG